MASLLTVLSYGTAALAAQRKDSLSGAAHEAAVLDALLLLKSAMDLDEQVVAACMAAAQQTGVVNLQWRMLCLHHLGPGNGVGAVCFETLTAEKKMVRAQR